MEYTDPVKRRGFLKQFGVASPNEFVESLLTLNDREYDIWKYFEERANKLVNHLWSIGILTMSVIGVTLSLPFLAPDFIALSPIRVVSPLPVIFISLAGSLICVFGHKVLFDIRKHILDNWTHAIYIRQGK